MKCAPLCFILLFMLSFSFCEGQSWVWAKKGINNTTNTLCDPYSIATDNKGNIFETGEFSGSVTYGSDTFTYMGIAAAAFLVKYDSNGNVLWANSAFTSTSSFSNSNSVATDKKGNSYITGNFTDTVTFGTFTLIAKDGGVFLVKYAPDGTVLWAKSSEEISRGSSGGGFSVATDKTCNVYVTGEFEDTISFGSYSIFSNGASSDVFLVKYDSSGNVLWLQSGNASSSESKGIGNSVTTDSNKNIYITGTYFDTLSFGPYILTSNKYPGSVFLVKYDSNGDALWAKNSITPNSSFDPLNTASYSVITDKANNVYITGQFLDSTIFSPYSLVTYGNSYDIFFVKYDTAGNVVWAKKGELSGTSASGIGYSLCADSWNHIYLAGGFEDTIAFGSVKLFSNVVGPSCIFMFDTSGKSYCGTVIKNMNDDANAVAANHLSKNIYFGGDIENNVCIFGNDTLSENTHEYSFLAKWQPCDTNISTSTTIISNNPSLSLFPNPNNGIFTIALSHAEVVSASQTSIEVYNVMGGKVYCETLKQVQGDNSINIRNQPNGIYFYRVLSNNGTLIGEGKVIIEK